MFSDVLERVGRLLSRAEIPYMVIGGQALLLYGEPRLTKDIDITLGIGVDEIERLKRILVGTRIRVLVKSPEEFARRTYVLPTQDSRSGVRIDFIFSEFAYERRAIQRAQKVKIGKTYVSFASVEDLIIHKILARRPRDLEDVESILKKHAQVNFRYIVRWLRKLELTLDQKLLPALRRLKTKAMTSGI